MKKHGKSGRLVLELDTDLKEQLYSKLSEKGLTFKDWVLDNASAYVDEVHSPIVEYSMKPKKINTQKLKIISMFSGCGGMDLGFMGGFSINNRFYPEHPVEIIWANDFNEAACRTYKKNIGHEIKCGDVWSLLETMPSSTDILVGGFPCQDISVNGKRAGVSGKKSGLYRAMVEAVKRTNPRVFIAENVKGLLMKYNESSLKQVLKDFSDLGYKVSYNLYRVADYGVPQTRERVIIVGTKNGDQFFPPKAERNTANWITAKEAIQDLEKIPMNPEINHIWSEAKRSPEQGNRKLLPNRPAYTIRAECHGNIQYHYSLPRRISMREAARFQSFPDNFIFDSKLRETERQVGNAVPPVFAWHIAEAVIDMLNK